LGNSGRTCPPTRPEPHTISRNWFNSINRADLSEAVRQKAGLSQTKSAALVEQVLKEIIDCLERGENVKLSSFGTFLVRKKGPRVGRNPKTGEKAPITPRRVIVFRASGVLKRRLSEVDHKTRNGNDQAVFKSDMPK
jgi:integration host factor subunit alpha